MTAHPESCECIRAHFERAFIYPREKFPEHAFTRLFRVWVDLIDISGGLGFARFVVQNDGGYRFILQRFPQHNATWHGAFSVLITSAELDNHLRPLIYDVRQGRRLGGGGIGGLEAQDVGEYGLGIFARLKWEHVNTACETV